MTTRHSERGYILASAMISMIVIAALAAGLVMIAVHELRRVRADEEAVQSRILHQSAIVLTAVELSQEPEARHYAFEDAADQLSVEGEIFDVVLEWESEKLDLNVASLDLIEAEARALGLSAGEITALRSQLDALRRAGEGLRLIGDLSFDASRVTECMRVRFTVFGGRRRPGERVERLGVFERPAPGTRVRVLVSQLGRARTADVVLLMTGDRIQPALIQDWRWTELDQINACNPIGQ